jgi:hypothetical protein
MLIGQETQALFGGTYAASKKKERSYSRSIDFPVLLLSWQKSGKAIGP